MTRTPNAPADTRMMGIVHDALRRDLGRAVDALATPPYPDDARRAAISSHIVWMVAFLHAHHHGEDDGLWPAVREREPSAAAVLDAMERDHRAIAPLLDASEATARAYGTDGSDERRVALLTSLQGLADVLLPHLDREERDALPIVSTALTDDEWRTIDRRYYIEPKSLEELGFEGHWLLDGLDPDRASVVVHQVPAVPRFVLVHGFARRYRRRAEACWGPARSPDGYGPAGRRRLDIPRAGRVDTLVDAPIEAVWAVVADVTRVGDWSHECRRVEWLDGAREARPGVRFRGTNTAGPWKWSRINEVITADAPRAFAWRTVPTTFFPDSTEWRIDLEPVDGSTRITQSYRVLRAPAVLARCYAVLVPSHRDRRDALTDDLQRLGEVAASSAEPTVPIAARAVG
jgi:Hemerythrin HHE cation binding domain/Polyketide cyclase / dehydrase and lipid transport